MSTNPKINPEDDPKLETVTPLRLPRNIRLRVVSTGEYADSDGRIFVGDSTQDALRSRR